MCLDWQVGRVPRENPWRDGENTQTQVGGGEKKEILQPPYCEAKVLTTVILGSTWPEGCLHCLVGGSSNHKRYDDKNKSGFENTDFKRKKKKTKSTFGKRSSQWLLNCNINLNIRPFVKLNTMVSVQVKGRATVKWSPFVRSVIYGPLVLLSCSGLPASVHCVLCSDITQHGWMATYIQGPEPNFQELKWLLWIHWRTYFKTASEVRSNPTVLFISNTYYCFALSFVFSFVQQTDQHMCDGVLKVNRHYSGEDTGMNIWTVSGLAVCCLASPLCLHLSTAKISQSTTLGGI